MWNELTEEQKTQYKMYCDINYGNTIIFSEHGEPLYMDKHGNLINTQIVLELLFFVSKN